MMPTVKSIDEYGIKDRLRSSDCPTCKEGLDLVKAHERVRKTEDHFRRQAIKKAKERHAEIKSLRTRNDELEGALRKSTDLIYHLKVTRYPDYNESEEQIEENEKLLYKNKQEDEDDEKVYT